MPQLFSQEGRDSEWFLVSIGASAVSQEGRDSEWFLVSIGASAIFSRGKGFRVVPSKHWCHCCFLMREGIQSGS